LSLKALNIADVRAEPRDEVHHRTRASLDGRRWVTVLIVNLSPHGLMIRSDMAVEVGATLRVQLPVAGEMRATVRWALGGRIGCQLEQPVPPGSYHAVLGAMTA
jgi:hypothetical protein